MLLAGPRGHRVVGLSGPTDPTGTEVAAAAARVLGRPVALAVQPPTAATDGLVAAGLPLPWARQYQEMYVGMASGRVAFDAPPRRGTVSLDHGLRSLVG